EGALNRTYSQTLSSTGGTGLFSYALTAGSMPPGLNLDPNTGTISGTPTTVGVTQLTFHVADAGPPAQFSTKTLTLQVATSLAARTQETLGGGFVNSQYTAVLSATGGTPPYTWTLDPSSAALPTGLNLTPTGDINGSPIETGTFTFTVDASDSAVPIQT